MDDACPTCGRWPPRARLQSPADYLALCAHLGALAEQDLLDIVDGTCPLVELPAIARTGSWPADTITHRMRCTRCQRELLLVADTLHGSASWTTAHATPPADADPAPAEGGSPANAQRRTT